MRQKMFFYFLDEIKIVAVVEKYFLLVVFNYLFLNGDAHLKNFSILESENGDYFLSPAYDLINTRLHVDDTDFALDRGLFADNFESESYKKTLHRGKEDFMEFAKRIGVREDRLEKLLAPFLLKQDKTEMLVNRSFLSTQNKRGYLMEYSSRRNRLLK